MLDRIFGWFGYVRETGNEDEKEKVITFDDLNDLRDQRLIDQKLRHDTQLQEGVDYVKRNLVNRNFEIVDENTIAMNNPWTVWQEWARLYDGEELFNALSQLGLMVDRKSCDSDTILIKTNETKVSSQ